MASLTRALEDEGLPLLDGAFLSGVTANQLRYILRGSLPIPLEPERLAIWCEVGPVLVPEFGGRWHRIVRRAGDSAVQLVEILVIRFPSFKEVAQYEGRRVAFYKRAQLAVGMLYQGFGGKGWGAFTDFDQLSVYADYKLPQVLRRLGILVYDEALAALVDSQTPSAPGVRWK